MKRLLKSAFALTLILASLLSLCSFSPSAAAVAQKDYEYANAAAEDSVTLATAESAEYERAVAKQNLTLSGVKNKSLSSYSSYPIYRNGSPTGITATVINGTVYAPLRSFVESLTNMSVTYNSASRTLFVNGYGLSLSVSDGAYVVYANDRPLFAMTPSVIMNNGRMYSPLSSIARALGFSHSFDGSRVLVSGSVKPLSSANAFYRDDEVLWLSRIIHAESGGESLLGKIAVGNVVMNRVRSSQFPNTIWGVIFDRKYGVQFSPVANGAIYNTPSYNSVLAAKICLEGFSLSDEVLFFLEPTISTSSWIPKTRKYVFSIMHHDFYA